MMRCVLSFLFTMGVGTMGIAGAALAADPPVG
jgi:Na+-driven multidrug efflux pump